MHAFRALRIHSVDGRIETRLETLDLDDSSDGDVVIRGEYSSINYKDALAATGAGRILRRFPLVGGCDVAGTVAQSADPRFAEGDVVIVNGCGLSVLHDGGYAEYVRVQGDWINPLPPGMSLRDAMGIGTAGFTAALAIDRMEQCGQRPDHGAIAVTGATGGVGSVAIDILSAAGYEVHALTSKADCVDYLRALGASEVTLLRELDMGTRPLEQAMWGGAVDNLGGPVLAWLTRTTRPNGHIASIGLAASSGLETTVMPFILRGVSLLGINSDHVLREARIRIWHRLASDLKPSQLDRIVTHEVPLADLPGHFQGYIDGAIIGRTIVRLR